MITSWQASIAHADWADWVTVVAYVIAGFLSLRAATHAALTRQPREGLFWRITAVLLIFLGVNELLDLQTLLTSLGRMHARENGWYGEHRIVQYYFILVLAGASIIAGAGMLWLTRRTHASVRLALLGLVFIGLFVLVRAASFHHADEILGRGWPVINLGFLQELTGVTIVAVAAIYYRRRNPKRPVHRSRASRSNSRSFLGP